MRKPATREPPIVIANPRRIRSIWLRLLLWCGSCLALWTTTISLAIYIIYLVVKDSLPVIPELNQYNPAGTTRVFSQSGVLLGEFAVERRDVVPAEQIPRQLVEALIASEDDRFFEHGGIDPVGILRAAIKNLKAGRIVQGGSTLTQQVAKSLIGREKTFTRKFKEAILARRLESKFTKEQILYLYLNQIYLGHGSYGVQAAAKNYFHKNVWELSLTEIATLAGLPQAPSDYDPVLEPKAALERRNYVLSRMKEVGSISEQEEQAASKLALFANPILDYFRYRAPYFTEEVRRQLSQLYTSDGLYEGGLTVETSLDLDWQVAAEESLYPSLRALDHRLGFRGVLYRLDNPKQQADFLQKLEQQQKEGKDLAEGKPVLALVEAVDENKAQVALGTSIKGLLPVFGMRWARVKDPMACGGSIRVSDVRKVLKAGDVILVRKVDPEIILENEPPAMRKLLPLDSMVFAMEQIPGVQGAMITVEPELGYVRTILGGFSFEDSEFNRILQSCRQPGSAFKPLYYSLAIDSKSVTPASLVSDAPLVYDDPDNEKRYKPDNIDGDSRGFVTVHTALVESLNRPSQRVLLSLGKGEEDVGGAVSRVIAWAQKLGITTPLRPELGLSLGATCVKPWDMVSAYSVFNQGGVKPTMRFIRKVTDRFGRVLLNHTSYADPYQSWDEKFDRAYDHLVAHPPRVIPPDSNYVMLSLMQAVASLGTGYLAGQTLKKPVAGKTGTTNDNSDVWFLGFTHDLVTGIWLGHDNPQDPLGPCETGSRTAVPIWVKYMAGILKDRPQGDFSMPAGICAARIDAKTGLLARPDTQRSVLTHFKCGTEPTESGTGRDVARPNQFFKVDKTY